MEFKQKLLQQRKNRKNRNAKAKGMNRVKVRGRKRWLPAKGAAGASPASEE